MNEYMNSVGLFLAQAAQKTPPSKPPVTEFDVYKFLLPAAGVIITSFITTFMGVVGGLSLAWKHQSDVYKDRLEQYKTAFDRNSESLKNSYEAEKRSLELLLQQKESDIKNLKNRIKRMESFYAIHFEDIDKGNTILEKLKLLLRYIENRVQIQDDNLSAEVKKMQEYLETQLGLVDRQQFRFEAAKWIGDNSNFLINSTTEYIFNQRTNIPSEETKEKIKNNIEQYLKRLKTMLRRGVGTENEDDFIDKTKRVCSKEYVKALNFIKDRLTGGQLNSSAYDELQNCIDFLIDIIKS